MALDHAPGEHPDDIAIIGWAQTPMMRHTDQTETQLLLTELHRSHPCAVVFVTHDVSEALLLGDRVVVLSSQPAKIADDFEISEPRPRSATWRRSSEAVRLEERILDHLHAAGQGQVRITL